MISSNNRASVGLTSYPHQSYKIHMRDQLKQLRDMPVEAKIFVKYETNLKDAIRSSLSTGIPKGGAIKMLEFLIGERGFDALPVAWKNIFKDQTSKYHLLETRHMRLGLGYYKSYHVMIKEELQNILKNIFGNSTSDADVKLELFLGSEFRQDSSNQIMHKAAEPARKSSDFHKRSNSIDEKSCEVKYFEPEESWHSSDSGFSAHGQLDSTDLNDISDANNYFNSIGLEHRLRAKPAPKKSTVFDVKNLDAINENLGAINEYFRDFRAQKGKISKDDGINKGAHKCYKIAGDSGYGCVYALDQTGSADYVREEALKRYLEGIQADTLLGCISLQIRPDAEKYPDLALVEVGNNMIYLNKYTAPDNGMDEVIKLAKQLVGIHRELYQNRVIHRDGHGGNLKIEWLAVEPVMNFDAHDDDIKTEYPDGDPEMKMKEFDFGKVKFGDEVNDDELLVDLEYLLRKKAVQFGDQIRRSFREKLSDPQGKIKKHYPLHRLINQLGIQMGDIDDKLTLLGGELISTLKVLQADQRNILRGNQGSSDLYKTRSTKAFADFDRGLEDWIRSYPCHKMHILRN